MIQGIRPELVFLDVQMPGLMGFEVLRLLPHEAKMPLIIFATAYDEYALAAFDANAIGYLLKPINREKLKQAVERAYKLSLNQPEADFERERIKQLSQNSSQPLQHLVGRKRDRFILLPLEQVCYCIVKDGIVQIKTTNGLYYTEYQMTDLESRLPEPPFFRAHRSAIVNMNQVREIAPFFKSSYLLVMKDNEASEVQVSERQSKKLRQMLQG